MYLYMYIYTLLLSVVGSLNLQLKKMFSLHSEDFSCRMIMPKQKITKCLHSIYFKLYIHIRYATIYVTYIHIIIYI